MTQQFVSEPFNPTVVRLRQFVSLLHECVKINFQSHCGAIATAGALSDNLGTEDLSIPLWCDCDCTKADSDICSYLSIPLWCDCDIEPEWDNRPAPRLSIPLWCDCDN